MYKEDPISPYFDLDSQLGANPEVQEYD